MLVAVSGFAIACISPQRAAQFVQQHPDSEFASAYKNHAHFESNMAYSMPAAVVPCAGGVADIFSCDNVVMLGHLTNFELGGGSVNDSWGWVDPETGREYALVGRSTGISFVDVTHPGNPLVVGTMARNDNPTVWADLKVFDNHAFIVADNVQDVGLQVFDLTRLRGVDNPPVAFQPDLVYREFASAHNIVINQETGFAYAVGGETCFTGGHVIDINDPLNPRFAGCIPTSTYIHDMQCTIYRGPDDDHFGKEICIANAGNRTQIFDVDDKADMRELSSVVYPLVAFSHQGWMTEDHRFFVMGDELDESNFGHNTRTIVLDIQDLDAPMFSAAFQAETQSIDHNQYVKGNLLYQANYEAGLRILRIDDPAAAELTEVAFFDTQPDSDSAGFRGAWNVYPFLPSGNILISDLTSGLFIVRPTINAEGDPLELDFDVADGQWVTDDVGFRGAAQGVTFDYLPSADVLFLAWFTYQLEPQVPSDDPSPDIGAPDNRWLTGRLQTDGNSAFGPLFASAGGGFDQPPNEFQRTAQVGEVRVDFTACDHAFLTYSIDQPPLSRTIELIPLEKRTSPEAFECRPGSNPAGGAGVTDDRVSTAKEKSLQDSAARLSALSASRAQG